jgi:hypothetical protein
MNDFISSTLSSDTIAANATLHLLHLVSVVVVYLNVIFISIYVIVNVHN